MSNRGKKIAILAAFLLVSMLTLTVVASTFYASVFEIFSIGETKAGISEQCEYKEIWEAKGKKGKKQKLVGLSPTSQMVIKYEATRTDANNIRLVVRGVSRYQIQMSKVEIYADADFNGDGVIAADELNVLVGLADFPSGSIVLVPYNSIVSQYERQGKLKVRGGKVVSESGPVPIDLGDPLVPEFVIDITIPYMTNRARILVTNQSSQLEHMDEIEEIP